VLAAGGEGASLTASPSKPRKRGSKSETDWLAPYGKGVGAAREEDGAGVAGVAGVAEDREGWKQRGERHGIGERRERGARGGRDGRKKGEQGTRDEKNKEGRDGGGTQLAEV
jgi:hypothetical protein